MTADPVPAAPATLAARWREDAQVFRRYGAAGRARMLERMADELERSARREDSAQVDLATAAELSGFTRGHLRRLIRDGKLPVTPNEAGDPQVRLADLPRKPGHRAAGARPSVATTCRREIAIEVLRRDWRKNSA